VLAVGVIILVTGGSNMTATATAGFDMTVLANIVSTGVFSSRVGTDGNCWSSSVAIGACLK